MAKRRAPLKKATNKHQIEQQLARYTRLLDSWVAKMVTASKRVAHYRAKTAYYQKRKTDALAAELAALEQTIAEVEAATGRSRRVIDLGDE